MKFSHFKLIESLYIAIPYYLQLSVILTIRRLFSNHIPGFPMLKNLHVALVTAPITARVCFKAPITTEIFYCGFQFST